MFWEKHIHFAEKTVNVLPCIYSRIYEDKLCAVLFPQFSWAMSLSAAAVLTQVSLITQKYTHDIFEFGALIISLEVKMLLAQWQNLICFLFY